MSTTLSATLIEFLERIFGGDKDEFLADPHGYLVEHGMEDLSCADFDDALVSFFENAEFDNDRGDVDLGADFHTERDDDDESDTDAIAKHLTKVVHEHGDTYITNHNDDRDTYVDNSFQGTVLGDATFDNDTVVASGDGAVAAGDDIEDSNIVTGDDNTVVEGDRNQVGDDSAFGQGSVAGGVTVDDGGAYGNNGGRADGFQDNTSDSFNEDNDDHSDNSDNREIDNSVDIEDSGNDNREIDNSVEDSGNTTIKDNEVDLGLL